MTLFYEQKRKVYQNADISSDKTFIRVSSFDFFHHFLEKFEILNFFRKFFFLIFYSNFIFRECKSYSDNPLCDYIDNDGKEGFGQGTDVRTNKSEHFRQKFCRTFYAEKYS